MCKTTNIKEDFERAIGLESIKSFLIVINKIPIIVRFGKWPESQRHPKLKR